MSKAIFWRVRHCKPGPFTNGYSPVSPGAGKYARLANLNHLRKTSKADPILFIKSDIYLLGDAHLLDALDSEALSVLAHAKAAAPTAPALHVVFDHFAHDSLAGFDLHSLKLTGHWRHRKGFLGNPKRLITETNTRRTHERFK